MNCNLLSFCLLCLGVADVTRKNFIFRYFIRGLCVLGKQVAAGCGWLGGVQWVGLDGLTISCLPLPLLHFLLERRTAGRDVWQ